MHVYKAPKTNFLFLLLFIVSFLTSCSKEHDLVSDFVIAEKMQLQSVTVETNSKLQPSASTESKKVEERATNLGK